MKKPFLILLGVAILSACSALNIESLLLSDRDTAMETVNAESTVAEELLISTEGIGKAKLGMTLGKLKQVSDPDTKFEVISLMHDVKAIAVSQKGLVQYYILYPAGTTSHPDKSTPTNNDRIAFLMTDNYNYRTREGVKVGMAIEEAEDIYGNAILSLNVENESREYINFGDNPPNLKFVASFFKSISDSLSFSGIYPEYPGPIYTTDKYQKDAEIAAIEVSCDADSCTE